MRTIHAGAVKFAASDRNHQPLAGRGYAEGYARAHCCVAAVQPDKAGLGRLWDYGCKTAGGDKRERCE